jgi:hypothetical protein
MDRGKIERGVGDDVGDLVQHRAGGARLPVLFRHDPVDDVERHAQEQNCRESQQRPARCRHRREPRTLRDAQSAPRL